MNRLRAQARAALSGLLTAATVGDVLAVAAIFALAFGGLWIAAGLGVVPNAHQLVGASR